MSERMDDSGTTYAVPPEFWHKAKIAGSVVALVAAFVAIGCAVGIAVADGGARTGAEIGFGTAGFVAIYAAALAYSARRATFLPFALTVGADALTVDWGGRTCRLPWTEFEYATTTAEPGNKLLLELRPRPGAALELPRREPFRAAPMPRPSRIHPGSLRVFDLTLLGPRLAECLNDIEQHLPVHDDRTATA